MRHARKLLPIVLFMILLAVPGTAGVRLGGIIVGVGYSHFSGPCCYNPYYFDTFDGYYGPYGAPWYTPLLFGQPSPDKGTVKLQKVDNTAEIYIDQAYAGVAKDLKSISLDPGAYDLEVRASGKDPVQKRVYVLSGKTVKLEF
jgi:hypothetical protein